MMLNLGF